MKILVTAAGSGPGNNLIRDIGLCRPDAQIVGTNIDRFTLARSLAGHNYRVPRAADEEAYIDALCAIVASEGIDLVIPNHDAEVGPVARHRCRLGARVLLPSANTIPRCQDKLVLQRALAKAGVPVAATHPVDSLSTIGSIFDRFAPSERLWCRLRGGSASRGSLPVETVDQARFWIDYWHRSRKVPVDQFLLCEYLPGRDFACQMLWRDGRLVIAKSCERLSYLVGEWMASGTSSTPRVGKLINDPRVNDVCMRAVRAMDKAASGLFCVDLKENRDGVPCVTEINIGRFFAITPVFNRVGRHSMVDLYIALACGEPAAVAETERFSDIGEGETYLLRELDGEPMILTAQEIAARCSALSHAGDHAAA